VIVQPATDLKSLFMTQINRFGTLLLMAAVTACGQAEEPTSFPLDERPLNRDSGGLLTSYADMLDPVRSAVVSVTSESIVRSYRGGRNPMEEFLRRFYGMPERPGQQAPVPEQPQERRVPNGLGSGVIISKDGYILTNNHVVVNESGNAADTIMVQLADEREFEAKLIGRDARTDIALLKIEAEDLPFVSMADSSKLRVGDIVFAIGNPLGVGQTTTMGIVSAIGRSNLGLLGSGGYENFIQTDAAINRGNSGGALVDAEGRLVGINSAILSPVGANIGIGFAIPSLIAREIAQNLVTYGEIRRGFLGVSIRDLTDDLAAAMNLESSRGVLVERVQEGQPAEKAGIQRGDVIVTVAGTPVANVGELRFQIARIAPGSEIEVEVIREGKRRSYSVILGSLDDPSGSGAAATEGDVLEGVTLLTITDDLRREWNLESSGGVLITNVDARSPYASVLQSGMVVLEVNRREVNSVNDLRRTIRSGSNLFWINFRGTTAYLAVRVP
jgi:serine protease Do